MAPVDFSNAPHVEGLLATEQVAWLTTVAPSGTPQPNVVWFVWDGEAITVFSQPHSKRIRNLKENGRVSLHFNTDEHGSFDAVITGPTTLTEEGKSVDAAKLIPGKYAGGLESLGMTPEQFFAEYSVAIRIEPKRIRGSKY